MSDTLTLRSDSRSMTIRICAMMLALVLCVGASLIFRSPYRVAYAEDTSGSETIIDAFTHGGQVVYNVIKKVVLPLAVIGFALGGIFLMFPGKNGPEKAKTCCICACIGVIVVLFAPLAIKSLGSWFGGSVVDMDDVVNSVA